MIFDEQYPKADRGKIIVWGLLSALPFGGMVWQVLHHIVGFRRLGFDVWYVEDSDRNLLDPDTWMPTTDYKANIQYIADMMEHVGLKDRWVFREPCTPDVCHGGKDFAGLMALYQESEAVFNLCNGQELLPRHDVIKRLVCLETDPGVPQISVALGEPGWVNSLGKYHYIFTYAENIGRKDCSLPVEKYQWLPTRPPVITDWWRNMGTGLTNKRMTTIANWDTKDNGIVWQGRKYYWQKDFRRFIDIPLKTKLSLELALVGLKDHEKEALSKNGWSLSSGFELADYFKYHDFICRSMGEFTVAKDQYVSLRTGWFSDRSVCYLAAGLPVVTEETGFSNAIPTGNGLFGFLKEAEILAAFDAIHSQYELQSRRAQEIAEEYFKAEVVLGKIIKEIGLG
jgi:hypothetical protein